MSALPLPVFERRLADLTREEFRDFVADLWAARGKDVTVTGADCIVTTPSEHEPRRLRILARNLPFQTGRGLSVSSDEIEGVDVVVTNVDSDRLRTVAADADVSYMGPERLRQISLYAIDRTQCEELFQQHFGRPIAEHRYQETPARRVQWMVETVGSECHRLEERLFSADESVPTGWVLTGTLLFVLLTVGIAVGTTATDHDVLHGGTQLAGEGGSPDPSTTHVETYPPGVQATGITNLDRLVAAHEATLANRSGILRLSHRHTRGIWLTNSRFHTARQSVRVGARSRRYTVEGSLPPASIGSRSRPFSGAVVIAGTDCSVRFHNASRLGVHHERLCQRLSPIHSANPHANLTGQYLTRYLGESGRLDRSFERDGRRYYRVVSTESPGIVPDTASGYRATATVAASGLVVNLSVTYETPRHGTTVPARFGFRITRVGNRSVP